MTGELTIVGTGIGLAGNMTLQTRTTISDADKVLYVVADEVTGSFLQSLNATAESMYGFYDETVDRIDTYFRMTDYIMSFVRQGLDTCAAFYGHPGIFVFPAHEALLMARAEGFKAEMKPAVSAEDCLFADLGIDPGRVGCQSFEVTDFLVYGRQFDPSSVLILWQVGVIGQMGYRRRFPIEANLRILVERLLSTYPPDHQVIVYEASVYPVCPPKALWMELSALDHRSLTPVSTLVVPPLALNHPDLDMLVRLGIPESYIFRRPVSRYDPLVPTPALSAGLS